MLRFLFYRNRFRQVSRFIHIEASADRYVVAKELQRNDRQGVCKNRICLRQVNYVVGYFFHFCIANGRYRHDKRASCLHFLNIADLLVCDQDIWVFKICFHFFHICRHICRNISTIKLHTFYDFYRSIGVLRLERFRKAESKRYSFDRVAGSDREGALRLFWRKAGADAAACFEPRLRHCGRRVPDGTAVQCTDVWNVSSHRRGRTD